MSLRHRGRRRAVTDFVAGGVGPLAAYYRDPVAFDPSIAWSEAAYLVLDVETTAIDPAEGHLLSMGWVCVDGGVVRCGSARHHYIRPPRTVAVGQSAVVHHITDSEAVDGEPVDEVVAAMVADLQDRVLVCHFAQLETGFLTRVCDAYWGIGFWPWQLVDTMQWHLDRGRRLMEPTGARSVRLNAVMDRYGLPATHPHDALSDAFGTALLLLAMADAVDRERRSGEAAPLSALLDGRSWTR